MLRKIGVTLWVLVLIVGAVVIAQRIKEKANDGAGDYAAELPENFDGRQFVEIPWKRLPDVRQFKLTERSGQKFDSATLAGKPYAVNFFFTNCKTICRDLNQQVCVLANRHQDSDLTFIGMSVKAKEDTPEVLQQYAQQFQCPDNWLLMTGQQFRINEIAQQDLGAVVDASQHHSTDIYLIDRWGRYRDRFDWNSPQEMKRFDAVAKELLAEQTPPLQKTVKTRNAIASLSHKWRNTTSVPVPFLNELQLTDQDGDEFYSRDLTGSVWVGSLFFSRCGSVCPKQNKFLAEFQPEIFGRNAKLVSVTTDPDHDTPDVLRAYARGLNAQADWHFLTGDKVYIQRVGSEFLRVAADGQHHASLLVVVDRWGKVRGKFDWQDQQQVETMLQLIDQLKQEQAPVVDFQIIQSD